MAPATLAASPVEAVEKPIAASVIALAKRCAPEVHPLTMAYLVAQESSNRRLAININGGGSLSPRTEDEAIAMVERLSAEGANFDVGYGQINSGNFGWLNTSAVELFDGCKNLKAAQTILTACYGKETNASTEPQRALRNAFSCYNTGNSENGYRNGYVASVQSIADAHRVPELLPTETASAASSEPSQGEPETPDYAKDAFSADKGDAFANSDGGAFENPQDTTAVMGDR
ncbi:lytic transglycosylase domain-containing protein [Salinicola sp. NYA28a]